MAGHISPFTAPFYFNDTFSIHIQTNITLFHLSKSDLPFRPIIIESEINIISLIEANDEKALFIRHYHNSHLLCISGKTIKKNNRSDYSLCD
jgi:hypothetical protein